MNPDEPTLLNKLSADSIGHDGWMHVCPKGESFYYFDPEDKETWHEGHEFIVQVIDDEACRLMAERYPLNEGQALVDFEHESMGDEGSTKAAGWGKEATVKNDGVWVRADWTPSGRAVVEGKELRFNSPCFPRSGLVHIEGNRYRPTKLGRIALTNNPNLRGQKPLTNSRTHAANPNPKNTVDYKTILLKLLGLDANATDDAINAACAALKDATAPAMNSQIIDLQKQLANKDLDAAGIKDEDQRELLRPMLTNKEQRPKALKLMESLAAKAPQSEKKPLHNRGTSRTPNPDALQGGGDLTNADDAEADDLHNRACSYRDQHKVSYEAALQAVRHQKPAKQS